MAKLVPSTLKAEEFQHDDQWSGCGFSQSQAIKCLCLGDPMGIYRVMGDIGQYRIGPAKGDAGGFAEKQALLC